MSSSNSADSSQQAPAAALAGPRMHKHLLYLVPQQYEQAFFAKFWVLDLVCCVVAPISYALWVAVSPFHYLLTAVYFCVLLLKGFHLALIWLSARQSGAYAKRRYQLVLADRVLRQCISAVLITRGDRARDLLLRLAHSGSVAGVICRILLVASGLRWISRNTLLFPLDFRSQVVLNSAWFCICFQQVVTQVAYAMAFLVKSRPELIWAQWWLESGCKAVAKGCWMVVSLVLRSSSSHHRSSAWRSTEAHVDPAAGGQQCNASNSTCSAKEQALSSLTAEVVAVPAGPAPDVTSVAGRLTLALSTCYMVLVVLLLPLFLSWRLERHLKSKMMVACAPAAVRQQPPLAPQQQQHGGPGSSQGGSGGAPEALTTRVEADACQNSMLFLTTPVVLPFFPTCAQLWKVLGLSCTACLIAAELFVLLCVHSPAVTGLLAKQVLV